MVSKCVWGVGLESGQVRDGEEDLYRVCDEGCVVWVSVGLILPSLSMHVAEHISAGIFSWLFKTNNQWWDWLCVSCSGGGTPVFPSISQYFPVFLCI